MQYHHARRPGRLEAFAALCLLLLLPAAELLAAAWGPYDLTVGRCIYAPSNGSTTYNVGWYTTTAGYGASRLVLRADDAYMATMPDRKSVV